VGAIALFFLSVRHPIPCRPPSHLHLPIIRRRIPMDRRPPAACPTRPCQRLGNAGLISFVRALSPLPCSFLSLLRWPPLNFFIFFKSFCKIIRLFEIFADLATNRCAPQRLEAGHGGLRRPTAAREKRCRPQWLGPTAVAHGG
jgi:hypothetical protein